ncbi:MAG: hypothetical protein ACI93R_000308 [Flavobacteriales bacterium]|jgi:hypothetical protein
MHHLFLTCIVSLLIMTKALCFRFGQGHCIGVVAGKSTIVYCSLSRQADTLLQLPSVITVVRQIMSIPAKRCHIMNKLLISVLIVFSILICFNACNTRSTQYDFSNVPYLHDDSTIYVPYPHDPFESDKPLDQNYFDPFLPD